MGFEPTQAITPLTVFKTVPLNHLGTPPKLIYNWRANISLDMIYSTNLADRCQTLLRKNIKKKPKKIPSEQNSSDGMDAALTRHFNFLDATHIRTEHFWDDDRAVSLLEVL